MLMRVLVMTLALAPAAAVPQDSALRGERVTVELRDGSRLVGEIVVEDDARLRVRTTDGLEVDVPRASIAALRRMGAGSSLFGTRDPNASRLMFAPTGRPLPKGAGYFSDYELLFPGVAVGLTDNLSLGAGVSMVPFIGLGEQLFYVSPKLGFHLGDRASVAVGGFLAGGGEDLNKMGILFGVGTFGTPEKSLSVGLGLARELAEFSDTDTILMVGGQVQVADSVALLTENWLFLSGGVPWSEQPFGVAVRFFGERLSADVGMILVGEVLEEGFPIPWVSFTYQFGPSRGRMSRPAGPPPLTGIRRRLTSLSP
jgi:hypothetical protein